MSHDHKYTIADDAAVHVLLDKMLGRGTRQRRREKLLKALEEASRHYQNCCRSLFNGTKGFVVPHFAGTNSRPGSVLYETESRIVYECPGRHQYETRKGQPASRRLTNQQ